MRVISGIYKGKHIDGFDIEGTRPTMDRVKESLFASIQNDIQNKKCLDLFAGSGSLGIEALSMGAKSCYFVEKHHEISKILRKNLDGISNGIFVFDDYSHFLKTTNQKFDIIFLDPPYKLNLITDSIDKLIKYNRLNPNALIVCEYEKEQINCSLRVIKEKKYGSKWIRIYIYEI